MAEVVLKINADQIKSGMENAVLIALEKCCLVAEGYAKGAAPVDTGNLRNSINHAVHGNQGVIGTNCEYASYVEFGTGKGNVEGGTDAKHWRYKDKLGHWHTGHPQPPRPFLRPAIGNHINEYKFIIMNTLKGG